MSERTESRKRELLGEFAEKFLMAVGYSGYEISALGDLSTIDPAKIRELLHAKTEEAKKIDWLLKNPPRIHRFDEPL
ncbi:MAG: hypothetical protein ABSG57_12080 [Candidatus Bathyarchaeia archaeon]|jgi:hypothetical protein